MLILISFAAVVAIAFLGWKLFARFRSDSLVALNDRRRATSQLVSRGDFVDGMRHFEVALTVTPTTLFYENSDMQASLDLACIQEVEYDTELVTGARIESGKVMRLRSDRQTFEFVIPDEAIERWRAVVPARGRVSAPTAMPA